MKVCCIMRINGLFHYVDLYINMVVINSSIAVSGVVGPLHANIGVNFYLSSAQRTSLKGG